MCGRGLFALGFAIFALAAGSSHLSAQLLEIETQRGVQYADHDGVKLLGDLYAPQAPGKYPALVAAHGGAFQVGSSSPYRYWGPYLAARGYVVFAVDYRLATE